MTAFLNFELRFWLRGFMVYVFLFIIGLMIFGAVSTDKVIVGGTLQNTYRNAPFVIQNFYSIICMLTLLMSTAFVNAAASRDFQYGTHQILFATPLRKRDYLLGRFFGSSIAALIPTLGVSLGLIVAKYMPWVDAERWRGIDWTAHWNGILCFAIPNTLFVSAVLFTIAVLTRSTIASFLGAMLLLVAYTVAENFARDLKNEQLAMMLDPFAIRTFGLLTKYWTVAERNTSSLPLTGILLWNRLLWLAVAAGVFAIGYFRFRFEERAARPRRKSGKTAEVAATPAAMPSVAFRHDGLAQWAMFRGAVRLEFWAVVKNTSFIVIVLASLLNMVPALIFNAREGYGISSLPVTYRILDIVRGTLYVFLIALVTYLSGVLVWRERDAREDEIHDSLPHPGWIAFASKLTALTGALGIILAVASVTGIAVQLAHKYTRIQPQIYVTELFVLDMLAFLCLAFLAFFIQVISPNKYVGYFGFIVFVVVNGLMWGPLNLATHMVEFADLPKYTYSDFYHFAPYTQALLWFGLYWLLFSLLLAAAATMLWPRGKDTSLIARWRNARLNFRGIAKPAIGTLLLAWVATAGWVGYNTKYLNKLEGPKDTERQSAEYEKRYKKYRGANQPRVQSVKYWIDLYPAQRNLVMRGEQVLENKSAAPIAELYLNVDSAFTVDVDIDRASVAWSDTWLDISAYRISPPLKPGERIRMKFTVRTNTRGFENSITHEEIVQNGTFFNNTIAPQIGYQERHEMTDRNDRRKYGLPEKDRMPNLERDCTRNCLNNYLSNSSDWVSVSTIISTVPDQIAIAPGSLLREWMADGRRYFEYKLDHDSLNFYSFISARYEVAREEWNGVKTEVYYHKEHAWNVPKMTASIKKTLDYCTRNFGPYAHKQARILEFPRFATFAQAFPGTMPYSEGIGFIADLKDPEDIDFVYYVTAHEMGHQWWAHQIVGANMQGATLLSETLAQYTALMVMEKEYGRDMMRKFLAYEMDRYLRGRGAEQLKERPLLRVESSQGYTHYQKGSVVLYYLKEMIGEEALNKALRKMLARFAYAQPPYPTSHHLVDLLREAVPADLQYLIKDLFEDITLFSNRTLEAKAKPRPDGGFDVTIQVESKKFKSDEKGEEKEVAVNDFIEIGAFAKPPKGKKYGETLYRQRVRVTKARNEYTFAVKQLPDKAGIDPFSLLIDRIPDDNTKSVTSEK